MHSLLMLLFLCDTVVALYIYFHSSFKILWRRRLCDLLHPSIPHILVHVQHVLYTTKKVVSQAFIVKIVLFSKIPSGCFPSTQQKLFCLAKFHRSVTGIFSNPSLAHKGWFKPQAAHFCIFFAVVFLLQSMSDQVCFCNFSSSNLAHI